MVRNYIKYFKWLFIITGILVLFFIGSIILKAASGSGTRQNTECTTDERVFDYGDVLTDAEEGMLTELIAKREKQTGYDIVLVTLNESLKEYAAQIEPGVAYDEFVRVYAEEFYDDNKFGFNKPIGDGVLLVDNWFREDDGMIYTWLCTVGNAETRLGSQGVEHILDAVYEYVEQDPYLAYEAYVNTFYDSVPHINDYSAFFPTSISFKIALAAAAIFILIHIGFNKGKKTTMATTYVNGGKPRMKRKEDTFLNKTVTRRHIERSSGSSGSGSRGGSSGGGRHGGGGRSR